MTSQEADIIISSYAGWTIKKRVDGRNVWYNEKWLSRARSIGEAPMKYSESLDDIIPICRKLGFNITLYFKNDELAQERKQCWQVVVYRGCYNRMSIESENPAEILAVELAKAILEGK